MPNVEKIRKRKSYKFFLEIYNGFENATICKDAKSFVEWVWSLLDEKCVFGSERNSNFAKESLELVIAEKGRKK